MAFLITGQMKVKTLQANFKDEFGLTLRLYDGRSFADGGKTIAQIRSKEGSGDLSVKRNMKVGNFEDKLKEEFGIKSQVAGSADGYLCDDDLTLAKALEVDAKKVAKEAEASHDAGTALNYDPANETQKSVAFACMTNIGDIEAAACAEFDEDLSEDEVYEKVITFIEDNIDTHKSVFNDFGTFLNAHLSINDSELIDLSEADEDGIRKAFDQITEPESVLLIFEITTSRDYLEHQFMDISEKYVAMTYCFYKDEVGDYITQTFEDGEYDSGYLDCEREGDDEYIDDYIVDSDDETWGSVVNNMVKLTT